MNRFLLTFALIGIYQHVLFSAEIAEDKTDPSFYRDGIVSFDRVGYGGSYTGEYRAIWDLSKLDNSEEVFVKLIYEGNPESAMYGLMGLKIIESDRMQDVCERIKERFLEVTYGPGGCVVFSMPSEQVVDNILSGKFVNPEDSSN